YSGIWNACNDTRNYLERALSYEIGSSRNVADSYNQWSNIFDAKKIRSLFDKSNSSQTDLLSLEKILAKRKVEDVIKDDDEILLELHPHTTDDELQKVRSILTFPQLLLHTLRIFRYKRGLND